MEQISLSARRRSATGKGANNRLRAGGFVPAIFYLGREANVPLELNAHELQLALKKKPKILRLQFEDGSQHDCVIQEIQHEPLSGRYLHVDFLGIVSGQKVILRIEVEIAGSAFGVRMQGGILQQSFHQLHVECYPTTIPEKIVVDVTELKVGSSFHVRDLTPQDYRIVEDPETTIATVLAPKVEKAAEVVEEAKPAEEAEKAEGAEAEEK